MNCPHMHESPNNYPLPPAAPNLARRIKRIAWAQPHDFFAICSPGLEALCQREMVDLGILDAKVEHGGLHFSARLDAAYVLHLHSRLLSRLLLRLKRFRVRNLTDFIAKLNSIPWEVFIADNVAIRLQSDLSAHSHLRHTPTLEKHLMEAINRRLQSFGLPSARFDQQGEQRLLLRIEESHCVVSLDLSGQHLHKRGYRLNPGRAPLRETLAAGLLAFCGYKGQLPLLDPMCGSGTIPLEAVQIALHMAPGLKRDFSLNHLPCHREATWQHLCKRTKGEEIGILPQPIFGRDQANLNHARQNARVLEVEDKIAWEKADFWQTAAPVGAPGLLVVNPPYGVRLGSVRQGADLSRRLARHLLQNYPGWQVGVVLYRPEWRQYFKLHNMRSMVVGHGGLKLTWLYGQLPDTI